jgi:hypothetical protein
MCGWIADIATALTPIGDELRRQVTAATYLQTGDTPVTILGPLVGVAKVRCGPIWIRRQPDRPAADTRLLRAVEGGSGLTRTENEDDQSR